jgi:hypothetical protein
MTRLLLLPIILASLLSHNARADLDDYLGCLEFGYSDCEAELSHNYDLPVCDLGEVSDDCESNPDWSFLV